MDCRDELFHLYVIINSLHTPCSKSYLRYVIRQADQELQEEDSKNQENETSTNGSSNDSTSHSTFDVPLPIDIRNVPENRGIITELSKFEKYVKTLYSKTKPIPMHGTEFTDLVAYVDKLNHHRKTIQSTAYQSKITAFLKRVMPIMYLFRVPWPHLPTKVNKPRGKIPKTCASTRYIYKDGIYYTKESVLRSHAQAKGTLDLNA